MFQFIYMSIQKVQLLTTDVYVEKVAKRVHPEAKKKDLSDHVWRSCYTGPPVKFGQLLPGQCRTWDLWFLYTISYSEIWGFGEGWRESGVLFKDLYFTYGVWKGLKYNQPLQYYSLS